jgi:flagellar basal-body rod protein FlgC
MGLFSNFEISGSALTLQRLKMDVVSANIANATTTRGRLVNGQWEPYRRKVVLSQTVQPSFESVLFNRTQGIAGGVKAVGISEDPAPFHLVYQPDNPDADAQGYVRMPNVDMVKEMVDMMAATRLYEANVTVLNASKSMAIKALEIGK